MKLKGHPTSLPKLFAKDPEAAKPAIDNLAEELEEELAMVHQSDDLFLRHSNDFGENGAPMGGRESIKGWRLHFDDPEGRIAYTGWGEMGELIAYLDASVSAEAILDYAAPGEDYYSLLEDDDAFQEAENQARLALRGIVDTHFLQGDVYSSSYFESSTLSFEACREAIVTAIAYEIEALGIEIPI